MVKYKKKKILLISVGIFLFFFLIGLLWRFQDQTYENDEYRITCTWKSVERPIPDPEGLAVILVDALWDNDAILNKMLSTDAYNRIKKNGRLIEIEYKQAREIPVNSIPLNIMEIYVLYTPRIRFRGPNLELAILYEKNGYMGTKVMHIFKDDWERICAHMNWDTVFE